MLRELRAHISILVTLIIISSCKQETPLFTLVPTSETGITFSNRITDNDTFNIVDFEYIYNGAGVSIADFNGDSLQDIFFTGNQATNRLYINKGKKGGASLQFADVTKQAAVDGNGKWCSGVALVDINNDGRMDIYVGATVSKNAARRENLLFINEGNQTGADGLSVPVFKERAREYGIADDGHTTHSAFFDYDNDGDLDLYVLTNTIEQYPNAYRTKVKDGSSATTDRLYRNMTVERKTGKASAPAGTPLFVNVSREAGILTEGYGLGVSIVDINRDGWKDIYVTNDYITDDLLYINNQKGGFTDRAADYFKHTSNSAMGNDVADINNDGLAEVVAVDMQPRDNYRKKMLMGPNSYQNYLNNEEFKYNYQYVRNTLQLNGGPRPGSKDPVFSEISLLADVAETDWSWSPLLADFDHDGYRDLMITNGFPKDITDRDFVSFRQESGAVATKSYLLSQIPVVKISNYAFRNRAGDSDDEQLLFDDVTQDWGLFKPSFSNGAAYGDLDNDGDLDYVTNNINDSAFVYRNNLMEQKAGQTSYLRVGFVGTEFNRMGLGALVEIDYKDAKGVARRQVYEHSPYRGYLSSVEPFAHFGLGTIKTVDRVRIIWPGINGQPARQQVLTNVKTNQVLTADARNANELYQPETRGAAPSPLRDITDSVGVQFVHQEPEYIDFNNQKLLPHKLSQFGPAVAAGDVNGDGLDDFFVGGSRQHSGTFFLQQTNGRFTSQPLQPGPTPNPLKPEEDMGVLLFDADTDGDLDLYIASGSCEDNAGAPTYQDRLYVNDGKGRFTLATGSLPANTTSKSCVKAADFDRDGDLDLFVGGRVEPDQYPKPVTSLLLRNDTPKGGTGAPRFTDVTAKVAPALQNVGLVCDALWTDPDNDGWPDLMLAGEFMALTLLKNGQKQPFAAVPISPDVKGWWNSLTPGDFDADGDIDYIAGNLGLNARMRASKLEPVRLYAGDFDNNGFYDAIPTIFIPETANEGAPRKEYTFHGRDDLIKQMIVMRKRFPLYKDFTTASIDKLLTEEEHSKAMVLEANEFRSMYLENKGVGPDGKAQFAMHPLPAMAQLGPIFGMVAQDVDNDGNLDVVLVGNDYSGEVSIGRYDALNGLWLRGNGKGGFTPTTAAASGFYVPGNAKGLAQLTDAKGRPLLVATQNRGKLCIFRQTTPSRSIRLQPNDASGLVTLPNGKRQRVEFGYSQSFLSQSARQLVLPPNVKSVVITDGSGKQRQL
ncbi:RNA-binding protein [Rudanella paleaurantiibacter]|uniref:RNA-binding protein n=1 Tax=Rudanella paleaurantiibacter TaxID=2614655 RepID=A0A7J5U134_9BACT|nr:VCBS repeat-containing protein [Rudanella paleaurantiibacter]KAB7731365.1 RNA-binding protein [Rudanella paleaurantiibacter]